MSPERWQRLETILDQALDLPPDECAAFLDRACADDPALRADVEAMLKADAEAGTFLQEPAGAYAATLLREAQQAHPGAMGGPEDQRIGPYRLLRELGRGGMGTVYLAERADGVFHKQVALKLIRRGLDTDDLLSRFTYEREILASLDHPNIARLLDGGATDDGRPYFVMEYVQGVPITAYCDQRRLPMTRRLALFRAVCRAVQDAHQNLVVHRDLKPSNILVTENGQVKLLDFGIAKLLDEEAVAQEAPLTRPGLRLMTPEYAAPEQIRGAAITTATDIYQLGSVLYELLTGRRPYRIAQRVRLEVERVILEEEPTRPSTAVGQVEEVVRDGTTIQITPEAVSAARAMTVDGLQRRLAGDLDNIVLTALKKAPGERYATVEQLADDVRRHLEDLPVLAQRDTLAYRLKKFVQRHRLGVAASALIVVLLVAVAAVSVVSSIRIGGALAQARVEAAKAEEVATFLRELFEVADPFEALGDTITAREILDRGAARIRKDLQGQPEVQGLLLSEMGQIYNKLGLFARADSMLQDAVAVQRQALGRRHPDLATTLHWISLANDNLGNYEASEQYAREALAMRRALLGDEHPDTAESMDRLASILAYQGAYEAAEPLSREAVAVLQTTVGKEDNRAATALHNLAWILSQKGDYEAAEPLYREVIEIGRIVLGADHPETLNTLNNLAVLLRRKGDLEEAARVYEEVLALRRKTLGPDHPDVGVTLHNLARLFQARGSLEEAASFYEQALSIWRKSLGPEHTYISTGLSNLALLEHERGRLAEAEARYRQALALQRKTLPEKSSRIASTLVGFGRLLVERGRPGDAEPLLREALAIREATLEAPNWQIAEAQVFLGACLTDQAAYEEAERLLLEGYPVLQTAQGDDHVLTQQARARLNALYTAWGKPEQATQYVESAAGF